MDPLCQALGHLRLVLGEQCLGEQAEGSHRGLQLVADVRHEVPPDVLEPAALGYVLDDRDHSEGALAVVDAVRPNHQGSPGRAVQLEHTLLVGAGRGLGEQLVDGLGGERIPVAAPHECDGLAVAEHRLAHVRR